MTTSSTTEVVGFPIYGISYDEKPGLLAVVGGGGGKYGIKNQIVLYSLDKATLKLIRRAVMETGTEAPMNVSLHNYHLLVGVNDRCWMIDLEEEEGVEMTDNLVLSLCKSFQTDHGTEDAYQKLVRHSATGSSFLTLGTDGVVRVWNREKMLFELGEQVIDAEFNSDTSVVYYFTAGQAFVYDVKKRKDVGKMAAPADFVYRTLYFHRSAVYIIVNSKDRSQSRLLVLDADGNQRKDIKLPVRKAVTTFSMDERGKAIVYGCADGSIGALSRTTLTSLYFKENAHSFAVTSIQVTQRNDQFIIMSGSADGNVRLTLIGGSSSSSWLTYFLIFLAIIVLSLAYLHQVHPELLERALHEANSFISLYVKL